MTSLSPSELVSLNRIHVYVSFASVDEGAIIKKFNKIFIEGKKKNCKFFTISSIKYKFRKWAKRLIKKWAKRHRVGRRNDSLNGGRNYSRTKRFRVKRLRANRKVGETTRYPQLIFWTSKWYSVNIFVITVFPSTHGQYPDSFPAGED